MSARAYPCCEHCADDQPHIEPDTHDLPCNVGGCQAWSEADARAEIDRLRGEVEIGVQMARAVIELVDEKAALEAERDRLRAEVDTLRFNLHECKSTLAVVLANQSNPDGGGI